MTTSLEKTDLWSRAKQFIPNGCQTLSKSPERFINGVYPKILISGHGCEVIDDNGKSYIDYISGLGAISIGYSSPAVDDAVKEAIISGQTILSLPHPKEADLAEKLSEIIPCAEMSKFFKTGSEAVSAAIRVSRAYTGKNKILFCGYNGWHDWMCATYNRTAGIPANLQNHVGKFIYNNPQSLRDHFKHGDVAAVVMEPKIYDDPKDNFLRQVIEIAHHHSALVVFDEIVSGFRLGLSGASGVYDVAPDLLCLGKAMGNGYPIAALCGTREIMSTYEREDFFVSGTYGGDLIGISAALAVIENIKPEIIFKNGSVLAISFRMAVSDHQLEGVYTRGSAPRFEFVFPSMAHKALFWQECVKRGVLFGACNFATMSHGALVASFTAGVMHKALKVVKDNWGSPASKLEGDMPKEVFKT